jgi:hypothetical protein
MHQRLIFFLSLETILEIPEFAPGGSDEEEKAPTVKKF